MEIKQFIINHWQYILSGCFSACLFVVNIIQALRTHNKQKLNELICRIPEVLRDVELLFGKKSDETPPPLLSALLTSDLWSVSKKATAESLLSSMYGSRFVNKHISVIDDAIEDILNTPQKKGGSNDGISKENEER